MKKYPYSNEQIMTIFTQLHKRGLAMFVGFRPNGEPAIWMTCESGLAKSPISIATADMLLDELLSQELDNAFGDASPEVLIAEILNNADLRHSPHGRRVVVLRSRLLPAVGLPR